jgi:F5/8 type C domain
VDFDDESLYDTAATVRFGVMLVDIGFKVTLCPYTNSSFWSSVRSQINSQRAGAVDRVYLQAYAGGAGNDPGSWNSALGMTVDPGLWSKHGTGCADGDSPSTVQSKMTSWRSSAGIVGGFIWYYDDLQKCPSGGTAAQYAAAVNNSVPHATPTATPTQAPTPNGPNLALNRPAMGSAACSTTETADKAVNGSVSGGNTDKFCTLTAPLWLQVDLGANYSVSGFVVKHASAGGEDANWNTRDFNIQVSTDAATWTTVVTASASTAGITTHTITARAARYAKLNITTPSQNGDTAARIYEFEVHGTNVATPTASATARATPTSTARATATSARPTPTTSGSTSVNLASAFNVNAAYTDGTTFPSTGGLDGVGSAYSSTLLGSSLTWSGATFTWGPANQLNGARNKTITLPAGTFTTLLLLGTGVNGDQSTQTVRVNYSDGTSSTFTQTFSNWLNASQSVPGQQVAVSTAYRNKSTGVKDNRAFNLYGYTFALTSGKTVSSLVLPATNNVSILAATLK